MAAVSCHADKKMTSQPSTREENVLSVQSRSNAKWRERGAPGSPGALVLAPQAQVAP